MLEIQEMPFLIRTIPSVLELHQVSRQSGSWTITIGRDFHPATKTPYAIAQKMNRHLQLPSIIKFSSPKVNKKFYISQISVPALLAHTPCVPFVPSIDYIL